MKMDLHVLFENPDNKFNASTIARTCNFFGAKYYLGKYCKLANSYSAGAIILVGAVKKVAKVVYAILKKKHVKN